MILHILCSSHWTLSMKTFRDCKVGPYSNFLHILFMGTIWAQSVVNLCSFQHICIFPWVHCTNRQFSQWRCMCFCTLIFMSRLCGVKWCYTITKCTSGAKWCYHYFMVSNDSAYLANTSGYTKYTFQNHKHNFVHDSRSFSPNTWAENFSILEDLQNQDGMNHLLEEGCYLIGLSIVF